MRGGGPVVAILSLTATACGARTSIESGSASNPDSGVSAEASPVDSPPGVDSSPGDEASRIDSPVADAAVCASGLVTLVDLGRKEPGAIAVDAENVYWAAGDEIVQMPKCGGPRTTLARYEYGPAPSIVVDETYVYWPSFRSILKVPIGGGMVATIAVPGVAGALAIDGTHLYFTDPSRSVQKVAKDGGAATLLTWGQVGTVNVVVDSTDVYWASPSAVVKTPLDGGTSLTLSTGLVEPGIAAVDSSGLYYHSAAPAGLVKVPLGGGRPITIAKYAFVQTNFARAGTSLYWAQDVLRRGGSGGKLKLMKLDLATDDIRRIGTVRGQIIGLAVDSTSAFWTVDALGPQELLSEIQKLTPD